MKKIILTGLIGLIGIGFSNSAKATNKKIDAHIKTTNGCDVHIVGTVTYTIMPPSLSGFTGKITVGPPCEKATYTFGMVISGSAPTPPKMDLYISFQENNPCSIKNFEWLGEGNPVIQYLNTSEAKDILLYEIGSLCQ